MAPLGVPLHPTQGYEAILLAALFYLRDEPAVPSGLKTAQLIGLVIAVLAVVLFIVVCQARGVSTPLQLEATRP